MASKHLAVLGVVVSHHAIWLLLRREGLRFKKERCSLRTRHELTSRRRARWTNWRKRLDPTRLVFIDEAWIKTNMAPLYGWGRKGQRLKSFAPHGHWRTLTFLGALRTDALTAPRPAALDAPAHLRHKGAPFSGRRRDVSVTLQAFLSDYAGSDPRKQAVADAVLRIAEAGVAIADLVAQGPLADHFAKVRGDEANAGGDAQKELDVIAEEAVIEKLKLAPVAFLGSEESETPIPLNAAGSLVVAVDPLDGSSNIDTNVSVGTIYSILPYDAATFPDPVNALMQKGSAQLAAGFLIYGPSTVLVSTLGAGTQVFALDRASGDFILAKAAVEIPAETKEYGVNQSNMRHWEEPMRRYVEDCLAGKDGPRGKDFNMRWVGSMVADAFRIFTRGGVYIYSGDRRKGYEHGRLRLIYEANPVAFITEQAKGAATDGTTRILDITPEKLHQRIPLVFGSREEVAKIASYY